MTVRQCRQDLERQFFGIDQTLVRQPVIGRQDQLALVLEQHRTLDQAVMGKREPTERSVDFACRHRLELVQHRQLNPLDIDTELTLEMPYEGKVNSYRPPPRKPILS
jgi:hypothetical protein